MSEQDGMRFVVVGSFEGFEPGAVIEINPDTMEGRTGRRLSREESRMILRDHLHHLQPLEPRSKPTLRML